LKQIEALNAAGEVLQSEAVIKDNIDVEKILIAGQNVNDSFIASTIIDFVGCTVNLNSPST